MGNRHQVYVRIPTGDAKLPTKIIGIGLQYLGAIDALKCLNNYLNFCFYTDPRTNPAKKPASAMATLRRFYDNGNGSLEELEQDLLNDPRNAWNNTGISIIDLTNDKPTYCFMSIKGLHDIGNWMDGKVRHPNDPHLNQEVHYANFLQMTAEHWIQIHYGLDRNQDAPHLKEEFQEIMSFMTKVNVCEMEDLGKMFPKMVTEVPETGLYLGANTLRCMDIHVKPIFIKSTSTIQAKIKSTTPRPRKKKKTDIGFQRAS